MFHFLSKCLECPPDAGKSPGGHVLKLEPASRPPTDEEHTGQNQQTHQSAHRGNPFLLEVSISSNCYVGRASRPFTLARHHVVNALKIATTPFQFTSAFAMITPTMSRKKTVRIPDLIGAATFLFGSALQTEP